MDPRRKRLLFRAQHCGMKENDIMLGGFAEARIANLSDDQLARFEALLDQPDNDVYNWISGRTPIPADQDGALLKMIQDFNKKT